MLRTDIRRTLDCSQTIRGRCGLTAGVGLWHSALPTILRHALAALVLRLRHCHRWQSTGHDGSRKQQKHQYRYADFARQFHKLIKAILQGA